MKLLLFSFFVQLFAWYGMGIASYTIIEAETIATGRINYPGCHGADYDLGPGEYYTEWRGGCLIRIITAVIHTGNDTIRASSYDCSGTAYSQFEIVKAGPPNTFCVRRVGRSC